MFSACMLSLFTSLFIEAMVQERETGNKKNKIMRLLCNVCSDTHNFYFVIFGKQPGNFTFVIADSCPSRHTLNNMLKYFLVTRANVGHV